MSFNNSLHQNNFTADLNSESATCPKSIGRREMICDNKSTYNSDPAGRNTFAFWVIVCIIFIMTIGNLILTMTIIGVLRLGKGMEFMEMVPEAETIKFFGVTDFDRLYKKDGVIEGFADVPMNITADNSNVAINFLKPNGQTHNKMLMSKNGTAFNEINHFILRDPQTNEQIFTTHKPHYNMVGADNLHAKMISASQIRAPVSEALSLNSTKGKMVFRGSEGVKLNGKEIFFSADQNLVLKSHNGSITLNGADGVFVDVKNIPIVGEHGIKLDNEQFKICVCMPSGKLFRVPIPLSSHTVKGLCSHTKHDPCI
ncbi:Beta-sarcoglycan [Pseudolycoriella hygida]|uniref:Beta-sarcoglycan n=1 Tax=Pseudolycoriella hygida TaxID=35572 RepID=A0A9Q0MPD0_9DIPT|nr:Beta-sarcoglycan [Pseudolycoriella hygida]